MNVLEMVLWITVNCGSAAEGAFWAEVYGNLYSWMGGEG